LLEGLILPRELKLLVDEGAEEPLDLIGEELVLAHLIRLPLGRLSPQVLLVTWQHNLEETMIHVTKINGGVTYSV
jgi:ABC-type molybdenum transport system ATPase subunit/photorepair protein PhrA